MDEKKDRSEQTTPSPSDSPQESSPYRKFGLFGVILGDLVGYTGAGIGLGYLAWAKLNAPWWVLLVLSLAGLSMAFYRLYQLTKKEL